jgi:leucyl aminopeptidase
MPAVDLPCAAADPAARPVHAVRPATLDAQLASLPSSQASYLRGAGFKARADEFLLVPGEGGVGAAVVGIGEDRSPFAFGSLPNRLPEGAWRLEPGDYAPAAAVLGFCLGAYNYEKFKPAKRAPARLVLPSNDQRPLSEAAAIWMVRDLINTPANLLGPAELADAAIALGRAHGATVSRTEGAALDAAYPTVATVGRGSIRPPVVAAFTWRGSHATDKSPLLSLCGKGVCFDTGGYDLKSSAGMLRMKKDMGGAATVLGMARIVMDADLPIRLAVRIGCVENSVSGTAMRPLDVIRTRRGLTVEVGNTDAEGRLVLSDLLAEASDERPDLLVDCATLTGAARVAVGPDLPALFCNDEAWATALLQASTETVDPMWRLPLFDGYDSWLDSPIADLNNVSGKPYAGAIVAALFLRRFVASGTKWAHLDLFAWNEASRPGRPEGGEAQTIRAVVAAVERMLVTS